MSPPLRAIVLAGTFGPDGNDEHVIVNSSGVDEIRQRMTAKNLRIASLLDVGERVALWVVLLNATHVLQRRDEVGRLAVRGRRDSASRTRNSSHANKPGHGSNSEDLRNSSHANKPNHGSSSEDRTAVMVHVVLSIIDDSVPFFAQGWADHGYNRRDNTSVKLVIYNKTRAINASEESTSSSVVFVHNGYERHDVPFTERTRNCASYVQYVDEFYDRLPDAAVLSKTNRVVPGVMGFFLNSAIAGDHDIDSHPWWKPAPRSLIRIWCDPRWAEHASGLYDLLCPCSDASLSFVFLGRTQHISCVDPPGGTTRSHSHRQHGGLNSASTSASMASPIFRHPRTNKPRPLVEEVFSEGIFSFSRRALLQQPRTVYSAWRHELATNGEDHQVHGARRLCCTHRL